MNGPSPDLKSIFSHASEIESPAEREVYLEDACGHDSELRVEVKALLAAAENVGSFMGAPAVARGETEAFARVSECPGTIIGPYKLLQQIGEGGMGVVFMAEQTRPVHRTVALKIIKPGMDSRQVIARFEAERQALALMDHPNIARVLDAGTTSVDRSLREREGVSRSEMATLGRPYFVMELVKGMPITKYCDEKRLSLSERLELFVPVCQAVQHAHQKGIIHRDLKPSNVMVALYDGRPVPKIIDFGVVKATGPQLTDRTMFTEFGAVIGTLEYMSPEQAELNQLDIDTRSDIYSLGVLLYELLTGSTPFERKRLQEAAFDEMLRIIREEEPPRPSTRLTTLAQLHVSTVSGQRGSDPQRLSILVRGELDWIVMKCLDKDRNRRYESANALAADVERYLNDEPIQACPPSLGYLLRKSARRHKMALSMAGLVVAGLLFAVVGLAISTLAISQARDSVQHALDRERRTAYFQSIALAEREWSAGNLSRAVDLLNECPRDLRGWEWRYLQRLRGKPVSPLRHDSNIFACAISPDGGKIASVDREGYIKIWNSNDGRERHHFRGHEGVAWCVDFSPDGLQLATGDRRGCVKIWSVDSAQELRSWQLPGLVSYVDAIAFSPDGRRLACANSRDEKSKYSSVIIFFNPRTGEKLLELPEQTDYVKSIDFSPDGRLLAAACIDDTIRISDAHSGETVRTFVGDADFWCVAFSPDGRLLAAGSGGREWESNGAVTIWDLATGERRFSSPGHGAKYLAFSPDGRRLATGGTDLTARIWDVATGQEAITLRGHKDFVRTVAFTPDGHRLVSASDDRTIRIWDATPWQRGEKRGEELMTFHGHTDGLNDVAFHPTEPRLATASSDGTVRIWDTQTGLEVANRRSEIGAIGTVAYSPDGKQLVFAGSDVESAIVVDADSGEEVRRLGKHLEGIPAVAFSADGTRLVSGGAADGSVMISDVASGKVLQKLSGHSWYVDDVVFSPDPSGRLVASAGIDGTARVWVVTTGHELPASPLRHQGFVDGVAFSPEGRFLATGSWDGMVRIWDTETWKQLPGSLPTNGFVRCLGFSPDGQLLAWGTTNALVQVWRKSTGEIRTMRGHLNAVRSVAFSPDGKLIASASQDGTAKLWQVPQDIVSP
jgi:WD40 repeat protein/serine/threonine protein kinase